jgi:prevent-host-death family protein
MERVVSATEARVHFGELLRLVSEQGQTIIVERDGRPQAAVISIADYEKVRGPLRMTRREALERLTQLSERIAVRRRGQPLTPAEDVIREAREERDAQFDAVR